MDCNDYVPYPKMTGWSRSSRWRLCRRDSFRRRAYSVTFYRQRAVVGVARQGASVFLRNTFLVLYFGMDFLQILKLSSYMMTAVPKFYRYGPVTQVQLYRFNKL